LPTVPPPKARTWHIGRHPLLTVPLIATVWTELGRTRRTCSHR
jgi:hypothetical protein